MKRRSVFSTGFVLFLLSIPALLLAGDPPGMPGSYTLGPGDKVKITVYGNPDISGVYLVDDMGMISMPLIQDVPAAGKTEKALEREVAARYSPKYLLNPKVNVEIAAYRPFYILGEVKKPGGYPYSPGLTALTATALAGGYTPRAKKKYVEIIRAQDPEKKRRRLSINAPVYPGDIVTVPERFF